MTPFRLILRSLAYYWRTNLVVVLGLALATAVVVGSLTVGDSVRGSLRDNALHRLGRIEQALAAPHFFPSDLAGRVQNALPGAEAVSTIILRGAATGADSRATVPHVNVVGVNRSFWELWNDSTVIGGRRVAINAALARDLSAKSGDVILLSVERPGAGPSNTLFARRKRQDISRSMRLEVVAILPDDGVGGFHLDASSLTPRNIFLADDWLMKEMGQEGCANVLLVAGKNVEHRRPRLCSKIRVTGGGACAPNTPDLQLESALKSSLTLADYGLRMVPSTSKGWFVQSNRLVMDDALVRTIQTTATACDAFSARTSIYLADQITVLCSSSQQPRRISYAVVAGVEPFCHFDQSSSFVSRFSYVSHFSSTESRSPESEEIWLNRWAATDLGVRPGDRLELSFLVPTADGQYHPQRLSATFRQVLREGDDFGGSSIVPDFPGITDARKVNDWQAPFPIDLKRVTARDEAYWKKYRATPKAFVNLEVARRMWQSRPGEDATPWATAVHVLSKSENVLGNPDARSKFESSFQHALLRALEPKASGLAFRPVRQEALTAAEGTTDFGQLFLAMSFFLLLAGVGLAAMLMRLTAERRAAQVGILLACGSEPRMVTRCFLAEGTILAVAGAFIGVLIGVAYAWGILQMMSRWWTGPSAGAFDGLRVTIGSRLIGGATGFLAGVLSAWWSVRTLGKHPVLELLAGWSPSSGPPSGRQGLRLLILPTLGIALAVGLVLSTVTTGHPSATMAFFGSGMALLIAGAGGVRWALARSTRRTIRTRGRLALRNLAAYPARGLLVFGVLAGAGFITLAVAASLRDLSRSDWTRKDSGTGGFALVGVSSVPLPVDFSSAAGRKFLGFPPEDEKCFVGVRVIPFLMSGGEDISCLNQARPATPRVLGVPPAMIERGGFVVRTETPSPAGNPWKWLSQETSVRGSNEVTPQTDPLLPSSSLVPDPTFLLPLARGGTPSASRAREFSPLPRGRGSGGQGKSIGGTNGGLSRTVLDSQRPPELSPQERTWVNAFGDADSVQWSLHSDLGQFFPIRGEGDARMGFRFTGLLPGSIFAGELLIPETAFRRLFPSIQAPRYFLIETPPGQEALVAEALRRNLGGLGLEVRSTADLLNRQVAVQNIYLRMFLALGGLGFMLGTIGLVLVLLRSALERRREFALMRAVGFERGDLTQLLWLENAGLLAAGLLCGTVAALVGVAPQMVSASARVNWPAVLLILGGILAVGLASCAWAARAATGGNLIEALREE